MVASGPTKSKTKHLLGKYIEFTLMISVNIIYIVLYGIVYYYILFEESGDCFAS
jgi:hypothetical protein